VTSIKIPEVRPAERQLNRWSRIKKRPTTRIKKRVSPRD